MESKRDAVPAIDVNRYFLAVTPALEGEEGPLVLWLVNESARPMTVIVSTQAYLDLNDGLLAVGERNTYALGVIPGGSAAVVTGGLARGSDLSLLCTVRSSLASAGPYELITVNLDRDYGGPVADLPVLNRTGERFVPIGR